LGDERQILFDLFVAKPDLLIKNNKSKKHFCQIGNGNVAAVPVFSLSYFFLFPLLAFFIFYLTFQIC